jgi:hypothetical protein
MGTESEAYRSAVVTHNVLGKLKVPARNSIRHLRELYVLSEAVPVFCVLRRMYASDPQGLPLLALLCDWGRDPLFRATTPVVLAISDGAEVQTRTLAQAVAEAFPDQLDALPAGSSLIPTEVDFVRTRISEHLPKASSL